MPLAVRGRDGLDHRGRDLGACRAVQVGVPVGERWVQRAHRVDVEGRGTGRVLTDASSQVPVFLLSAPSRSEAASAAADRASAYISPTRPARTPNIPANPATVSSPPVITSVLVAPIHPAPGAWYPTANGAATSQTPRQEDSRHAGQPDPVHHHASSLSAIRRSSSSSAGVAAAGRACASRGSARGSRRGTTAPQTRPTWPVCRASPPGRGRPREARPGWRRSRRGRRRRVRRQSRRGWRSRRSRAGAGRRTRADSRRGRRCRSGRGGARPGRRRGGAEQRPEQGPQLAEQVGRARAVVPVRGQRAARAVSPARAVAAGAGAAATRRGASAAVAVGRVAACAPS